MNSDVLIIGGGVIGLSIARQLHNKGVRRITIVDRGRLGGEASWAAAGMLAPNIETDISNDFHRFGTESLELYTDFAAALLEESGVDVELDRTGTLCLAFDDTEQAALRDTYRRQTLRGVPIELMTGAAVRRIEPTVSTAALEALYYPSDWQVDNRKLLLALQRFAELNNIRIVENFGVEKLLLEGRRVTGAANAERELHAGMTILATGAWTSLITIGDSRVAVDVRPIRGQMISFQTTPCLLRHVVYSGRGYLVPRLDGRVLVGATVEDVGFAKAVTDEGVESLTRAASEILPSVAPLHVTDHWSGLRPFTADGLPVIGEVPDRENLLVATGHYRNGILLAPKTAQIIADKIVGNVESEYLRSFGRWVSPHKTTTENTERRRNKKGGSRTAI